MIHIYNVDGIASQMPQLGDWIRITGRWAKRISSDYNNGRSSYRPYIDSCLDAHCISALFFTNPDDPLMINDAILSKEARMEIPDVSRILRISLLLSSFFIKCILLGSCSDHRHDNGVSFGRRIFGRRVLTYQATAFATIYLQKCSSPSKWA